MRVWLRTAAAKMHEGRKQRDDAVKGVRALTMTRPLLVHPGMAGALPTACVRRLTAEYAKLAADPVPHIHAAPNPTNLLELHFVIVGADGTPYSGGLYHGKLQFTTEYPHKPPAVYMFTPSGRFEINKRICLSISDFHPETWVPAWRLSCVLIGVLSFMLETTRTEGSVEASIRKRQQLARASHAFNRRSEVFCELFPELVPDEEEQQPSTELEAPLSPERDVDGTTCSCSLLCPWRSVRRHARLADPPGTT